MRKKLFGRLLIVGALICIFCPTDILHAQTGTLSITEFMAANNSTLSDEDGDFSDWIEIHNAGGSPVNLQGYGLSDDSAQPNKWIFPNVTINAGQYLVVFASGKSRAVAGGQLHTNFKLSASGEYLALSDNANNVISVYSPSFPQQHDDISFGINNNGQERYFSVPTPGSVNGSGVYPYQAAPPTSSLPRGFYNTPQSVALASPDGGTIRYTLDGSTPSTSNGSTYTAPLSINQTTTLRAVGISPDSQPSDVETFTYIFVNDVVDQGIPAGWPTEPVNGQIFDYGMDPEIVTGQREAVKQSLLSIPSVSIVTHIDNLFDANTGIYVNAGGKGSEWERAISVEWLNADNTEGFQIDGGLRIRGGGKS